MYYIQSYHIKDFQNSSFPVSLRAYKILGNQNTQIYSYLIGIFIANHQKSTIDKDGFFVVNKDQLRKILRLQSQDLDNAIERFKELDLCIEKMGEEFKLKLTHPLYELIGLSTDYFNMSLFEKVNPSIIEWITEHKNYLLENQANISLLINLLDEYSKTISKEEYEKLLNEILTFNNFYGLASLTALRAALKNFINHTSNFRPYPDRIEFT